MKKTEIAIFCLVLAMACLLTACAGKTETRVYKDGTFSDVTADSPYRDYIAAVYELGLMQGRGEGDTFGAGENISIAEAIAFADRVHSLYVGDKEKFQESDPWYQVYVDYAVENKILDKADGTYNVYIYRNQFADLMAHSMPAEALPSINTVVDDAIPDVTMDSDYADSIYLLYRAGIFTGKDDGSFGPNELVTRAEVAQTVARMAASNMRGHVTLNKPAEKKFSPDLEEQPSAGDDYFKDAAIVGNSLVEGLKLYSKLNTITYYSGTSMSVTSAESSVIPQMLQKQYAKIYIELGINEIGNSTDYFKGLYSDMIDKIKAAEPDADIYIMAILPVSKAKSAGGSQFTIDNVKKYNTVLYDLATEKQCYYLDDFAALIGEDGYLPAEKTWDGVHLTPETYSIWENCIRTHYAAEK